MLCRFISSLVSDRRIGCLWVALIACCTGFATTDFFGVDTVIVHEWGTFTSMTDEEGAPILWAPLSDPSDLPCFVHRLGGRILKSAGATVRMETPVLYFYAPRPLSVSVRVRFPQGVITEWYPRADKVEPATLSDRAGMSFRKFESRIEWDLIDVFPNGGPGFPVEKGASRYYAARNTWAAALRAGEEAEKFLFYRGIGGFSVPLRPKLIDENFVELKNVRSDPISEVILFENREGKVGYRRSRDLRNQVTMSMPDLCGDLAALSRELEEILIAEGLYPEEARAMLETWRDSWFEVGTRVLYIVPHRMVDSILPLTILPVPSKRARVFVGRVEMLSPWTERLIDQATLAEDIETLGKYGRFAQPWIRRVQQKRGNTMNSARVIQFLNSLYTRIQAELIPPACGK